MKNIKLIEIVFIIDYILTLMYNSTFYVLEVTTR